MSLENTLREMLNEMKMPPYKKPLDPTVHSTPEEKPLPSGVHTGSQKPKPKPSEITRTPGRPQPTRGEMQEETLVEHYKQRLEQRMLEEGMLKNIGARLGQMDLSPGSLARATGRTASRIGNLLRGRGFKTGDDIAYEREEARAEAQKQVTPPESSTRPSSTESPKPYHRMTRAEANRDRQERLAREARYERSLYTGRRWGR